jgi:hypothetical protein
MTLSSISCSCDGENPNCFKCWGTGMVSAAVGQIGRPHRNLAEAAQMAPEAPTNTSGPWTSPKEGHSSDNSLRFSLPKPCVFCGHPDSGKSGIHRCEVGPSLAELRRRRGKRKAQKDKVVKLPNETVQCPICNISLVKLEQHLKKVHAVGSTATNISSVQAGRKLQLCPVCGAMVKSLTKHAKKTGHGPMVTLFDKAVPRSKARSNRLLPAMLNCPHCRASFPNTTQLASHVAGSHGKRALQNLGYQARSGTIKTVPDSPPHALPERPNNMDAKHGWGGSFRDNGQFGSYPLHDGMDDESFS